MVRKEDCEVVYKCGHCGLVYNEKSEATECCLIVLNFLRDRKTGRLYSKHAFDKKTTDV